MTTPPPTATTTSARVRPQRAKSRHSCLDRLEVLGLLAVVEEKGALFDAGVDRPRDGLLGDDGGPVGADRQHLDQAVPGAGADQHRVGAVAEVDANFTHRLPAIDARIAPGSGRPRSGRRPAAGDSRSTSKVRSASSA